MIRAPITATLYITDHCQFRCDHCFLTDQRTIGKHHLAFKKVIQVLDDLANAKVFMVVVSGGDPLLHPNFEEIIDAMFARNLLPLLGINSVCYTEEQLGFLKSRGLNHVQISVDSISPLNIQKGIQLRSLKEFDRGFQFLMRSGFRVTSAITLNNQNILECYELTKWLINAGAWKVKISFWEETKHGRDKGIVPVLVSDQIHILNKLQKLDPKGEKLVFQGFSKTKDNKLRKDISKLPRLIIRANGSISCSETTQPIGWVGEENIVDTFTSHRAHIADQICAEIERSILEDFSISEAWRIPRTKLGGSGAVLDSPLTKAILVADDLSPQEQLFVIAHEVGHLALNVLSNGPREAINRSDEIKVNKWAISRLMPYLTSEFLRKITEYADQDEEDLLFQTIKSDLNMNLLVGG